MLHVWSHLDPARERGGLDGEAAESHWLPNGAFRSCLHRAGLGPWFRGLLRNRRVRHPRRIRPHAGVDYLACCGRLADEGIVQSAHWVATDPRPLRSVVLLDIDLYRIEAIMSGRLPSHRCPPVWHELEVGADISWWLTDRLVDSPIEQVLDSSAPALIASGTGRSRPPVTPWNPLRSGPCQATLGATKYVSAVRSAVCGQRRPKATDWK